MQDALDKTDLDAKLLALLASHRLPPPACKAVVYFARVLQEAANERLYGRVGVTTQMQDGKIERVSKVFDAGPKL
ncbi:MAG: hypothetical protein KGL39_55335 [Patescibacteria group bacterium]|nr:hypothetical protein [Patescibacteria group bacterium]